MTTFIAEDAVEAICLEYFDELGWSVVYGPDIAPEEPASERASYRDVLLEDRLAAAVERLNPGITPTAVADVLATFRRPESVDLKSENWRTYAMLTRGVPYERRQADGTIRSDLARLINFDDPISNDFVAVNQFTVEGDNHTRRPDVVAFVNGIPLGIIELKVPGKDRATMRGAFDQLRTYAAQIPALMSFSACCMVSTGTQARIGPLPEHFEHFAPWKTIDGTGLAPAGSPELEVLVRGVFDKSRFLDLVRNFVIFGDERVGLVKRLAKYHQFHAVNKAVTSTLGADERVTVGPGSSGTPRGRARAWRCCSTSRKSWRDPAMANPTVVLITDRNDLDDQLFDEVFAPARTLPRPRSRPIPGSTSASCWRPGFGRDRLLHDAEVRSPKTGAGCQPGLPGALGAVATSWSSPMRLTAPSTT